MTEQIATTYDEDSLTPEPEDDLTDELEDASEAASSSESEPPTTDEAGEGPAVAGAEEVAGDLPSRLVARMGSEHASWTFADPSDGEAWAAAAFEFCNRYCPRLRRCPGDECRLHRFERDAIAATGT